MLLQKTKPTSKNEISEGKSTNRLESSDNTETQNMLIVDQPNNNNAHIEFQTVSFQNKILYLF